jgi:hypothetical protein
MKNEEKILAELQSLKTLVAKLIGTPDLKGENQYSKKAIEKAAREFQKLSIERGEWVESYDIKKYIKTAPYNVGNFLRDEFGFTNCFKRGSTYYYNKQDLIALGQELKERNVDLGRYMEFKADKDKFEKYVAGILQPDAKNIKRKRFRLPEYLKDITTSPATPPDPEVIKTELKKLKDEFFEHNLNEYIDIYKGSYAMPKDFYRFKKYLNPELTRRIYRWTEEFNLANQVIEEITKKKEKFIPIPEEQMIRL